MRWIAAAAFVAALGWASAAHADGLHLTIGGGHRPYWHRPPVSGHDGFRERRITVSQQFPLCYGPTGTWQCGGAPPAREHHRPRDGKRVLVVPRADCYVPGYWSTQWVPQTSLYNVWVPSYWSRGGDWVEGHYEQRAYVSGYLQQSLWVAERWTC